MDFVPEDNPGKEIDHIDGNELNQQKNNLRIVDRIKNIQNVKVRSDNSTTGIRGVSKSSYNNRYRVDFSYNKQRFYFKEFKTLEEAVYVRYLCELEFLKEFRNCSNDEYINELISRLPQEKKDELYKYFKMKINK